VGLPFPDLEFRAISLPDINEIGKAIFGKNQLGKPLFMDVEIDGKRLPNEPLVTVTSRKIIEETVLVGSEHRGTVKEFISAGDFQIKIEGICIDTNSRSYPKDQVELINSIVSQNKALDFYSDITEIFEVHRVVINDFGFGNMKGKPNSQSYFISCTSDMDFYAVLDQRAKFTAS